MNNRLSCSQSLHRLDCPLPTSRVIARALAAVIRTSGDLSRVEGCALYRGASLLRLILWIAAFGAALAAFAPRCAAQGFPPIAPDELKMTSEPQAPGAPAVILYREVDRDDNGRTSHEDNYVRIKILKEEGRSYGDVEIPFDKASEDVVNIHARTIKPDGTEVPFDGKVYEKTIEKARGRKYLAKTLSLPNVEVGSIVECRWTYDFNENYIFNSLWVLSSDLFTRYARFSLKPYTTDRIQIRLRWTWQGLPAGSEPKKEPNGMVRMEAHNIPAFQEEEFMPPADELKARVNFIYDDEFIDQTAEEYWKHVGKKRNGALESFIDKRKTMEEAVAQAVSPTDPPEVKLRKLYDRVQKIRNTSYEVQKSAEELKREKEKPAQNVEDIWKRGYGDGMQLTWLYLALVRAAGFDACGVWAASRGEYFFTPKTMEGRKLNSNLVLVKLNGKEMYFDPGAAFTPFGMLTWPETATPGLCLNKDGGTWITTSFPQSSESMLKHSAKLKLGEAGDLEGTITFTYTGLEAMYRRVDMRNADDVARKKFLEERVKNLIPASAEVDLTSQPDWSSSEAPLVAEFHVTIPGWAMGAGKHVTIPASLFNAAEQHTFEHTNRVHPIYVEYPYEKEDDVTIDLPAGWQIESLPPAQKKGSPDIGYTLAAEKNQSTLHLTRTLNWNLLGAEVKYYPALRNFFQDVRTGDEQQIVLQPAATSAAN